ncbi:hypothetical protein [Acinetobacter sp. YH01003]|uniref:hypothetical protein n=1 Tax=Acinetobacter sp. YH01003 TaxID=2601019 RepID=UPI0015D301AA|nr:hypothetical protein [Acinetobacter sp. YH01003]
MILDKKQNFSLKPLSVACLLTMSISGCSSGSGSQSSTVQVTDVLGAENVSQEDQPTTNEGIGSGVEQPVAPSAPITDQPPVNLELDHGDASSNGGGLSGGSTDHGNTSPTEDSLLDSNDATVLENNDVNQPNTIPTLESPPSEAEQPVDVVAPPAVEPALTDTVLVDSAIQDIEAPQDTSDIEMGSAIQEPEPSQNILEVETDSAFLETKAI